MQFVGKGLGRVISTTPFSPTCKRRTAPPGSGRHSHGPEMARTSGIPRWEPLPDYQERDDEGAEQRVGQVAPGNGPGPLATTSALAAM